MQDFAKKIICGTPEEREELLAVIGDFSFSDFSEDFYIFPGFCDVHVHFREPGFSYKETIKTGSLASAKGGYTSVCTMPNLRPVPDSVKNLNEQLQIIEEIAL